MLLFVYKTGDTSSNLILELHAVTCVVMVIITVLLLYVSLIFNNFVAKNEAIVYILISPWRISSEQKMGPFPLKKMQLSIKLTYFFILLH